MKRTDELPAILLYVIEVDRVTGERVAMSSSVDTPTTKLLCFFVRKIPAVSLVKDTIRKCTSRADREEIAIQARAV